jgi:hypothetical protein
MTPDQIECLGKIMKDLGLEFGANTGGMMCSHLKGTITDLRCEDLKEEYVFESHNNDCRIFFNNGDVFLKSLSKTEALLRIKLF